MILRTTRRLGALAVLVGGAVHLQQYLGADYSSVPTIGPLFLLNAIGSAVIGFALLAPIERAFRARRGEAAVALLALGGIMIAIGALVGLFISETSSLFGFSESSYETPMIIATVAEVAAVLLLAPVAVAGARRTGSERDRQPTMRERRSPSRANSPATS
jgi:hypothetical protein